MPFTASNYVLAAPPRIGILLLLAVLIRFAGPASAEEDNWKFDIVHFKHGETMKGLIVKETPTEILFQHVSRKPGHPTRVFPTTLAREDIDSVEMLEDKERERLAARIRALDRTGKGELLRMQSLELKPVPWGKDGKGKALAYQSVYFRLMSNAGEEIVRRTAVRLEQLYFAYTRYLPPRCESAEATTILLAQCLADYQKLAKDSGFNFLNPAFFDATNNHVICTCELQQLGEEMDRVRAHHQLLLDELSEREKNLKKLYKNKVPPELMDPITKGREKINDMIQKNEAAFQKAFDEGTRRLMQRLFHESFHAYVAQFVYPPADGELPRWLNEGMAQVFEHAILEGDELRVGRIDKDRLAGAQKALEQGELVSLVDLLKSGPKQFLVAHATEQQDSDRYYLTCWAVSHYLLLDRRMLGTKAMDRYVRDLHGKTDPLEAFRELVNQPLPKFEKEYKEYLEKLKPDGTVGKIPPKK
jgi:hypothetical protein